MFRNIFVNNSDNILTEAYAFITNNDMYRTLARDNYFNRDFNDLHFKHIIAGDNLYVYDDANEKWYRYGKRTKHDWFFTEQVKQFSLVYDDKYKKASRDGYLFGWYDIQHGFNSYDTLFNGSTVKRIDIFINVSNIDLWYRDLLTDLISYCMMKKIIVVLFINQDNRWVASLVFDKFERKF